ncbi:MAG: hypothetical protein U0169_05840 [Polyangiaceae bacterium]
MKSPLLVVAGEASGDRAAAGVVSNLPEARAFGMGGSALGMAGADVIVPLDRTNVMGFDSLVGHAANVARAWHTITSHVAKERPRAALLTNFSEFNSRLAKHLSARGIRVLFYGAPQVWAWRRGRMDALRPWVDRMAVMLPFEEALWRAKGVDAHYVGHPARETTILPRNVARRSLDMTPFAPAVALLPGSRPGEVKHLLEPMLEGFEIVRRDRASLDARVVLASSIQGDLREWVLAKAKATNVHVTTVDPKAGASNVLGAFDVALSASGTVTLEATLAGAVPIVVYKVGPLTEFAAKRWLETPHVALPNVLLGRRAFPELLQDDVNPGRIAREVRRVLRGHAELLRECANVVHALGDARTPSARVASMIRPWLA